jgi:predicted RNA binding protein YcfA (HicA-like mRNA interferase family)
MSSCDELLNKARNNPRNVRFEDLCKLAECYGYVKRKAKGGSHRVYSKPNTTQIMNFQNASGKAKPYQVRQLLKAIEESTDE